MYSQYPGPQPHQMQCGHLVNQNNCGQPHGCQIPTSSLNQQAISTLRWHHNALQLGTYTPVASYLGNGSRGTSSAGQNPVCSTSLSDMAPTSGSTNRSSGYSMPLGSSLNFQVVPKQGALVQTTHIPSSVRDWHTWNSSQTFLEKSTPGSFQSQSLVDWHSKTNKNGIVMPVRTSQMLSGQPQTTGNDPDVNRSSIPEQTSLPPHLRCDILLNFVLQIPIAYKCCSAHLMQAMDEKQKLLSGNTNSFPAQHRYHKYSSPVVKVNLKYKLSLHTVHARHCNF